MSNSQINSTAERYQQRADEILAHHLSELHERADHLFAGLLLLQWLAAIIAAAVVSPLSWHGSANEIHIHVWTALFAGAAITIVPVFLALRHPGEAITRQCIAIAQALFSALFIHLSGGRIETHFHVFGSLALLAFYRDWRLLITNAAIVAADHLLRGFFLPQSVYGTSFVEPWRWLEHASWVALEVGGLIVGIQRNIEWMRWSAEREAELEDLTAQRTRELARIVQLSRDAIFSYDLEGTITSWNDAAANLHGYSAEEAIGSNLIGEIFDDRHEMRNSMFWIARGDALTDMETSIRTRAGRQVDVAITASPLRDTNGTLTGVSVIARDITEKKEAEKRISEFYSVVSHELRTPLTSIRGALSLLDSNVIGAETNEGKEMVSIALSSSQRLIRLINEILDLRKIEAGKMDLHLQALLPATIIEQACAAMRGMATEFGVTLAISNESTRTVDVDSDRITQVLTNLLSNALKFSPRGSTVVVSAVDDGRSVRFAVKDQGPGIAVADQHKLFNKFQQIDSSDTRPKEGTGLGLAISKSIIELHKGQIGFVSVPGSGSTFYFQLPAQISDLAEPAPAEDGQPRILIVEDDVELAQLLMTRLSLEGYSCFSAGSKARCVSYLESYKPDAILLDLCLPDASGTEMLELVRSHRSAQDVPVIVMTGNEKAANTVCGPVVFDVLIKPFDPVELMKAVQRAVVSDHVRRVLVVDDDADVRAVISAQLRMLKIEPLAACDGHEAIRLLKSATPDLIILDVAMPNINGFEVVEWLRSERKTHVPVIIYSGHDLTAEERERLSVRLTEHLVKGAVSEDAFLQAVSRLLEKTVAKPQQERIAA